MKKNKLIFIVSIAVLLAFIPSLSSCKGEKVIKQSTLTDFKKYLKGLSPEERQSEFKYLREKMGEKLKEAEDFQLTFGLSISLSSGNDESSSKGSINWDSLDIEESSMKIISSDSIQTLFKWHTDSTYASQDRMLPNSEFKIYSESYSDLNSDKVNRSIKTYFHAKENIDSSKIGLKKIDSLAVDFSYNNTLSFDSLIIKQGVDSVLFQGHVLYIDKLESQSIELDIPIELYEKFEGHLGVTPNKKYITSNSKSYTPVWGLAPYISSDTQKVLDIFHTYSNKPVNDEDFKLFEAALTEKCFLSIQRMLEFDAIIKEIDKLGDRKKDIFKSIGDIRRYIEEHIVYLAPVKQNIEMAYPYPVDKIILFFTNDDIKLTSSRIIPIEQDLSFDYETVFDSKTSTYGIIDSIGNIVIFPQFKTLSSLGDLIFYDGTSEKTYLLDINSKSLKHLKTNHHYFRKIDENYNVFVSKDEYSGVLDNDMREVVPFDYKSINNCGNLLIAGKMIRGRSAYDLFTKSGKKLDLPLIRSFEMDDFFPGIILIDNGRKKILLSKEGKVITSFEKEKTLNFIGSEKVILMEDRKLKFFVDISGNLVKLPLIVDEIIKPSSTDMIGYITEDERYGFIDEQGQTILPPVYGNIYNSSNGVALVRLPNDHRALINREGDVIKDFGEKSDIKIGYDISDVFYVVDEIMYNWKGNLTNMKKDELELKEIY